MSLPIVRILVAFSFFTLFSTFVTAASIGDKNIVEANVCEEIYIWSLKNAGINPEAKGKEDAEKATTVALANALSKEEVMEKIDLLLNSLPGSKEEAIRILQNKTLDVSEKKKLLRDLLGDSKFCPLCKRSFPFDFLFCPYDQKVLQIAAPEAASKALASVTENAGEIKPAQKDAVSTPDDLLISNDGYKSDKKGPVKLSHKKHSLDYKIGCIECHHVYQDGKNIWKDGDSINKCSDCHDPKKNQANAMKLQNAYHRNCKTCHKIEAKKGKNAPYKKCNECHQN
jgi:hypothetical protein